jgi:hypothetical protein
MQKNIYKILKILTLYYIIMNRKFQHLLKMFDSRNLRKEPLSKPWIAAHMHHKLKKADYVSANIPKIVGK